MKIGIDLDDVMAICSIPYLRRFAQEFNVELPDESQIGWHLLSQKESGAAYDTVVPGLERVTPEQRDQFRIRLYDSKFFAELEVYKDCPVVLERLVAAEHELYFITARAERRRYITETWLREKGIFDHAKAVHLKPIGDFRPESIQDIFLIKKQLLLLRRSIVPLRDVFNTLLRREQPIFPREIHVLEAPPDFLHEAADSIFREMDSQEEATGASDKST